MIFSRIFRALLLITVLFAGALHAAQIEVAGKHSRADGSVYDFQVVDGDALSPGDRFQIIITANEPTYYAIVYVSRDGNAAQIFPQNNRAGRIKRGTRQYVPGIENFFTLDVNGGRELMFIVTSPNNISNLRSVLKNASSMTSSSQVHDYLSKRLHNVQKLEITNTGKNLTSTVDQVSSSLVRDLSATYEKNPWPASVSQDYAQQQRVRQGDDNSIPEAVRRRTAEVRSLLKRPAGATGSSSLRTVKVPGATTVPSTGEIRRDTAMLVAEKERQEEEARLRQVRLAEEERQRQAEIEAARLAQQQAEAEAQRLQLQREEAERLEAQRQAEQEALEKSLEEKRQAIAAADLEAQRQAELRAEEERLEAEGIRLEQERLEQIRLAEAAKREEERRIAEAAEAERLLKLEEERREAARLALAAEEREEAERLLKLEEERREAERLALAEARRKEAARLAEEAEAERQRILEAERREAERLAAEEARRKEDERLAAEQAARQEADRRALAAAEAEAARLQQERELAQQQRLERERAEEQARLVAEQRAQELVERQSEEARRQAEIAAEEEQLQAEQLALNEKLRQQQAAEEAQGDQAQSKGFFGQMLALVKGEDGSDSAGETGTVDDRAAAQSTTVVETDSTGEVILNEGQRDTQPVLTNQAAEAPREAVVVLQAPDRPAPKKLTAPAPVRPATASAEQSEDGSGREIARDLYDQVASAIVSINTKNDPDAAGFILDSRGHILTAWHVINGVSDIGVNFMAISGAPRTYKARVIKYNKFQDLALLQLIDPPEGIQPITVAPNVLPDVGAKVRVFGQKGGQVWATDDAVITRIAPHFTWFSKDNVIHRGEVLQVDLPQEGREVGSLVTSMDYQMLGIKSFSGSQTGRTYAVSVRVIRDFVESEGQAAKQ